MREKPILFSAPLVRAVLAGKKTETRRVVRNPERFKGIRHPPLRRPEPYGKPGELLWVRETWRALPLGGDPGTPTYGAPGSGVCVEYKAGGPSINFNEPDWCDLRTPHEKWRPSIHMPRWASRITLRVTDVRVERLQEITTEAIIAEGLSTRLREYDAEVDLRRQWVELWDSINGTRPGCSWDRNPPVWVVSFEVRGE